MIMTQQHNSALCTSTYDRCEKLAFQLQQIISCWKFTLAGEQSHMTKKKAKKKGIMGISVVTKGRTERIGIFSNFFIYILS